MSLDEYAIYTCPNLTELFIPFAVKEIGKFAFGYTYEHTRNYRLNYFSLKCEQNPVAEQFPIQNHITYELIL